MAAKGQPRKAVVADAPKSDTERIGMLEQQVLLLRKAFVTLMLQNPQVQEALVNKMIESGEV